MSNQSLKDNIVGYGCVAVFICAVVVLFLLRKQETLFFAGAYGVMFGIGIAGIVIWHGLIRLIRSQTKWIKETVNVFVVLCGILLAFTITEFSFTRMTELYKDDRIYFFVVIGCATFVSFYGVIKWEDGKPLREAKKREEHEALMAKIRTSQATKNGTES